MRGSTLFVRLRDLSGLGLRAVLFGSNASLQSEVSRDNLDSLVPRISCSDGWESRKSGGQRTLFVPDSDPTPSYVLLTLGVISFFAAVVWTYKGKAWIRFHGWVYRAEEPIRFWWEVAMYYLVGVCFIGYFLFQVYVPSN
jgi:hypothetical protein